MSAIHEQLKKQRKALGLKQEDMMLRVGMARQQYQRLEAQGNPRLDTLELVAKGLKMELILIPQEKRRAVRDLLNDTMNTKGTAPQETLSDNPWQGLLGNDE